MKYNINAIFQAMKKMNCFVLTGVLSHKKVCKNNEKSCIPIHCRYLKNYLEGIEEIKQIPEENNDRIIDLLKY